MTEPIIDALIELEEARLDSYYRADIHPELLEYWHRHGPGRPDEEGGGEGGWHGGSADSDHDKRWNG